MAKSWKFIKDSVHHYIKISDDDLKIIDTPLFQRLRNIHHLGTGYLTYPGATHSRFEHSLGVAELGTSVLNNIIFNSRGNVPDLWNIDKDELEKMENTLRYACLLHDIGHSPFSHTCEEFFKEESKRIARDLISKLDFDTKYQETTKQIIEEKSQKSPHEILSCSIVLSEYSKILKDDLDVNPPDVCAIILGRVTNNIQGDLKKHYEVLANIVSSPIDVDKFDYLLRDNYMTGATLVTLDKERLLSAYMVTKKNHLLLSGKALSLVSNLMIGRQQVFMWIYQHHKVVYTDALLRKIINKLIENESTDKEKKFSQKAITSDLKDDYDIISWIRNSTDREICELYESWRNRTFLKACWKHAFEFVNVISDSEVQQKLIWDSKNDPDNLEKRLSDDLGLDNTKVVVAHAKFVPFVPPGLDIQVELNGEACSVGGKLGLFTQGIQNYCEVPYFYVEESNKKKVIDYLKDYS